MITRAQLKVLVGLAAVLSLLIATVACTPKAVHPKNTVFLSIPNKIKGLDPAFADDQYMEPEIGKAYEGLLQYHYLKRPYQLIPNLAAAMPEVSADGLRYTFKIKQGVLFQDDACFKNTGGRGREMTAEDVFYTFARLADPAVNAASWWVIDGKLVGVNEWRERVKKLAPGGGRPEFRPDGIKVVDRYTIEFRLTKRIPSFVYTFAMPQTFVVAREAVETYGKDLMQHAVGTGPFRLKEFNGGSRIVWDRNPTYRQELYPLDGEREDKDRGLLADAGKPLPRADRMVMSIHEELQPAWLDFLAGRLDASVIPKDNYDQALDLVNGVAELKPELKAKGIQLLKTPMLDVTFFVFNLRDPLLGRNKFLRQAMTLAYDSPGHAKLFFNGRAIPAQSIVPPGLWGYDPKYVNPFRHKDLARARELLAKAGYPGGKGLPELEFLGFTDTHSRQLAESFAKQMGDLGIRIRISPVSWAEYSARSKAGKGQIWYKSWTADYPDAENFWQLFYGKNVSPGDNDSHFVNTDYDRLYERMITLASEGAQGQEKLALYQKMRAIMTEECPIILNLHRVAYGLYQPWMKNFKFHDVERTKHKYLRSER